ncbi:MAG: methionyl-tRNA formyltransferase, partial [Candidatus Bipolaricaulota bacterium]|nr:methionyl-tRNA formyltransferase [Candidatus Bipolaricaulota bacterium]MDW8127046.1 methionyl-tRNA formyltransferase [Candidatus Bipolaricaulota bacterium]
MLQALAERFGVLLVITQPDKPAGRGLKLTPPPVKLAAQKLGLPLLQPKSINSSDCVEVLRSLELDLLVTAAFGQLLRPVVLKIPRLGCVNVHASLLPKYRGAAPINWALIHGERESGVTTFLMDEGMDTGPILLQRSTPIDPNETAGELEERLARMGAALAVETVEKFWRGEIAPKPQPPNGPLAPKLHKEDGRIRWEWEARRIHNLVRGLSPKPGAYTTWQGELVKVLRTRVVEEGGSVGSPGSILPRRDRLFVAAGQGVLEVLELQPAGCRIISGR